MYPQRLSNEGKSKKQWEYEIAVVAVLRFRKEGVCGVFHIEPELKVRSGNI